MQRRRLPLGLLLAKPRQIEWSGGRILSLVRRKEAISWRMHFLGVASVVKVIWFRFRISAARELPSSIRPGFAPIHRAFTTSKSVTAISSSTSPSAMGPSTPIAVTGSKDSNRIFAPGREQEYPVSFLSRFCTRGVVKAKGKMTFSFCLCLLCCHHDTPVAAARRTVPLPGQRLGLACYDVL
jgi:hypothetical protein